MIRQEWLLGCETTALRRRTSILEIPVKVIIKVKVLSPETGT